MFFKLVTIGSSGKKVSPIQDPLYYRDPTHRLVRREIGLSQPVFESPSSSSSESESVEHQSESIPISGLYIDLPFESVSNPLYQTEVESVDMA